MIFEKNGERWSVTDKAHIDCLLAKGFSPVENNVESVETNVESTQEQISSAKQYAKKVNK